MLRDGRGEITIMKSTTALLILPCVSSMTMRTADSGVEPERAGRLLAGLWPPAPQERNHGLKQATGVVMAAAGGMLSNTRPLNWWPD